MNCRNSESTGHHRKVSDNSYVCNACGSIFHPDNMLVVLGGNGTPALPTHSNETRTWEAIRALIDIRDGSAYDTVAKARAAMALERLEIK